MSIKYFFLFLCSAIMLSACENTVKTSAPKYELNLDVVKNFGSIQIRLEPVGDIHLLDLDLYHNDTELQKRWSDFEEYIFETYYPEDSLLNKKNTLTVNYMSEQAEFNYSYNDLALSTLENTYADTIINGNPYLFPGNAYTLTWNAEGNPDYHILKVAYNTLQNHEMIETNTTIVTTNLSADLSAKFAPEKTLDITLEACWGPMPGESGYTPSDKLPVNYRKCSIYRTNIEVVIP